MLTHRNISDSVLFKREIQNIDNNFNIMYTIHCRHAGVPPLEGATLLRLVCAPFQNQGLHVNDVEEDPSLCTGCGGDLSEEMGEQWKATGPG